MRIGDDHWWSRKEIKQLIRDFVRVAMASRKRSRRHEKSFWLRLIRADDPNNSKQYVSEAYQRGKTNSSSEFSLKAYVNSGHWFRFVRLTSCSDTTRRTSFSVVFFSSGFVHLAVLLTSKWIAPSWTCWCLKYHPHDVFVCRRKKKEIPSCETHRPAILTTFINSFLSPSFSVRPSCLEWRVEKSPDNQFETCISLFAFETRVFFNFLLRKFCAGYFFFS